MEIIQVNEVPEWVKFPSRNENILSSALYEAAQKKKSAIVFVVENGKEFRSASQAVQTWKRSALSKKIISSLEKVKISSRVRPSDKMREICVIFDWSLNAENP